MGLAVSKCDAAPDPTILPPPPPPPGAGGTAAPCGPPQPVNEKLKNNPGTYEELSKKCKGTKHFINNVLQCFRLLENNNSYIFCFWLILEIFPQPFEGAKVVLNKSLNQGFQISHALTMSSLTPTGYRFGSTYIGCNIIPPSDPALVLFGDTDPSGNLNAQGFYNWNEYVKTKFAVQVMNSKFAATQMGMDVKGLDYTASVTLANLNLFNETGVGVFHYLQQVTPKLCLGAELMFQQAPQIPGGKATALTCSGRYTSEQTPVLILTQFHSA